MGQGYQFSPDSATDKYVDPKVVTGNGDKPVTLTTDELEARIRTPEQRQRRKNARGVWEMFDAIAIVLAFEERARQTAWVISCKLYDRDGQDANTPRPLSLATLATAFACKQDTASKRAGELFIHDIPQRGYQILSRFKAETDSGEAHKYASHLFPIAAVYAEIHENEKGKILSSKNLTKKEKGLKIAESLQRLAQEAIVHLPTCDTELLDPAGETYAYVSGPEAGEFLKLKREYTAKPYKYTPPVVDKPPRPLVTEDFERRNERARRFIDDLLDEIAERNSLDEAQLYWRTQLLPILQRAGSSWIKVFATREQKKEKEEELIHVPEIMGGNPSDVGPAAEIPQMMDEVPPMNFMGGTSRNPPEINQIDFSTFPGAAAEASADPERALGLELVETNLESFPAIVGSINFDDSLEAALWYAKEGWPVLPICNYDQDTGRCTASWHPEDCVGKKPLVKAKGERKPGEGYTAATCDESQILKWYRGDFRSSGVGLRLDGKVLIDADLKDGGPASYIYIRDTFGLEETLTQATQGGGGHYVFNLLPESEELLKSWTRILDKIQLPGIDLKVGKRGLLYAEPTRGKKGVYRWVDTTVAPATLPHEAATFFHSIRHRDDRKPEQKAKVARAAAAIASSGPRQFDHDQAKYFRDLLPGETRHRRLFDVACAIRSNTRASAAEIAEALRYHASRFTPPLDDEAYIQRTAREVEAQY